MLEFWILTGRPALCFVPSSCVIDLDHPPVDLGVINFSLRAVGVVFIRVGNKAETLN